MIESLFNNGSILQLKSDQIIEVESMKSRDAVNCELVSFFSGEGVESRRQGRE